jgi:hypothetical protein
VNDISVIAVYSLPAFLPLGIAIVVFGKKDWSLGPRLVIAGSLLLSVATWIALASYWWLATCWETWSPCSGSPTTRVFDYLLIGSLIGLVAGVGWLVAGRRVGRRIAG